MSTKQLEASIPANNQKIIELYNKLRNGALDPSPLFQRKLVWKRQHKFNFINTILMNFPFPEVYIAPGKMDTDSLTIKDLIVDGQQRLSTIANYIESKDVFAFDNIGVVKFSELEKSKKEDFLNYEVSVRYLKNANEDQIKDIFQRINSTEYALNAVERINAQWGDSEFICFGKQIVEQHLTIDMDLINYKISEDNRVFFLDFFHEKYKIFTEGDINRMIALQYILVMISTIRGEEYFKRNDKVQEYIKTYNEEFVGAGEIEYGLSKTLRFLDSLQLEKKSYWFNKANLFTLCIELYKFDVELVDKTCFKDKLLQIEQLYNLYIYRERKSGIDEEAREIDDKIIAYFNNAREAVNNKNIREERGQFVFDIISGCLTEAPTGS